MNYKEDLCSFAQVLFCFGEVIYRANSRKSWVQNQVGYLGWLDKPVKSEQDGLCSPISAINIGQSVDW